MSYEEMRSNGSEAKVRAGDFREGRSRRRSRSPIERGSSRKSGGSSGESKASRRIYVANVPFDVKWSDLKDLFREKIGNVSYCQLFEDENGRSRGCGLIEFQDAASATKAIKTLHRYNYKNRELVVKEDLDCERDRYGRLILPNKSGRGDSESSRARKQDDYQPPSYDTHPAPNFHPAPATTYGLSTNFLESLGVSGPLNNRIFVANLDYKVGEKKLEEIFRLAGKVLRVRLYTDPSGSSKGHGTVEFEHPVEAVQAISMFHDQKLYSRPMSIRMDKYECEEMPEVLPSKLPSGLEGIGKGLGIGGQPLNVSKSLLNTSVQTQAVQQAPPPPPSQANPSLSNLSSALPQLSSLSQQSLSNQLSQLTSLSSGNPGLDNSSLNVSGYDQHLGNLASSLSSGLAGLSSSAQNVLMGSSLSSSNMGMNPDHQSSNRNLSVYSTYERDYRDRSVSHPASDTVVVRNLPTNFNWQSLRDRFSEIGQVVYAELKNRVAIIRYSSTRDAARAVDLMNGMRIDNRPVDVMLYY